MEEIKDSVQENQQSEVRVGNVGADGKVLETSSLSFDTKFMRQADLVPRKIADLVVRIIGCGAIGSMTAIMLAKMGVNRFDLWDPDVVNSHNLPNQFYPDSSVGMFKVESLKTTLESYGAKNVAIHNKAYDVNMPVSQSDVVICAVDSMDFRKALYERMKLIRPKLYIESRMGGLSFRIYSTPMITNSSNFPVTTFNKFDTFYKTTLYSDKEAVQEPCTSRATIFTVGLVGSFICNNVRKFLKGDLPPIEIFGDFETNQVFSMDSLEEAPTDAVEVE